MSSSLISRSEDLRRLRDDGYEVTVVEGHLVVAHVPYATRHATVGFGTLICELSLRGDVTARPATHVAYFAGDLPCDSAGEPLRSLVVDDQAPYPVSSELVAGHTFSARPVAPGKLEYYQDYFQKITTYTEIIGTHARVLDPAATARTYRPVVDNDACSVFSYADTASSRAGITGLAGKLAVGKIAIVGLGGTGSYLLDLLAKTPVRQIHLFDGDEFSQHNAFRSPGAATIEELRQRPKKVQYLADRYCAMRADIVPHACDLGELNVAELDQMDFVFIAIDDGPAKGPIIDRLEARDIPFIDVGMGVYEVAGRLAGIVRTTVSAPPHSARRAARARISRGAGSADDVYGRNIQTAELNALNAALAVISWKKLMGFYNDLEHERFTAYVIDTSCLISEDHA